MVSSPGSPCDSDTRERRWNDYWTAQLKELPVLPSPRPRALTPDLSSDSGVNSAPTPRYQESSFWFKVPPNIRRDILRLAFGDTRLHLFIDCDHPDVPREPSQNLHCDIARGPLDDNNKSKRRINRLVDKTQPQKWQWWGSRCHRVHPSDTGNLGPMTRGGSRGPWTDYCRNGGSSEVCEAWRRQDGSSACQIGVMGWLLSCRQKQDAPSLPTFPLSALTKVYSYMETIDILYSANTLILEDTYALKHLPKLLLPQRLKLVTSLEITWPIRSCRTPDSGDFWADVDVYSFDQLLNFLSLSQFPSLRHLYVYLPLEDDHDLFYGDHFDHMDIILNRLDPFVRQMTHLIECSFALPKELFKRAFYDAKVVHNEGVETRIGWGSYGQIWRDVNGNMTTVKLPYQDNYPGRPYGVLQDHETTTGYWILEGSEETAYFRHTDELLARGGVFGSRVGV